MAEPKGRLVLVESGPITRITLNRPEKHNAISTALGEELRIALSEAGSSPAVKVIILRGAGPSFSAGDDRSEHDAYHNPGVEAFALLRHGYFNAVSLIRRIPKPVVAQVHGYCLVAAFDIVLACDFAIADEAAKLGTPRGRVGFANAVFLPKYLGLKRANEILIADEPMSAARACELGLINKVSRPGELEADVHALADHLVTLQDARYGAFGLVKDIVNRSIFQGLEDDQKLQALMIRLGDFYHDQQIADGPA
jgi:enoyl-CoA hydratase/carnithine racemase